MKKSRYFIALFGAVLMFFIFPVVSNAVLSGYSLGTWTLSVAGSFSTLGWGSGYGCAIYTYKGTYPDNSQPLTGGVGYCVDPYIVDYQSLQTGSGDYFTILETTDGGGNPNGVRKEYYGPNTYLGGGVWTEVSEEFWGVEISTPVSGTTITDTATELVGAWDNIIPDDWNEIALSFVSYNIQENSKIVYIPVDTISGNFSIPLSDFGITINSLWTLQTIIQNDYEMSFDFTPPTYALTFNVSGFTTPYAFTDFETWYDTNVPNYEAPSDWASAMIGFLQPIFEKVGEYGNRVETYLNITEAYAKGFQIGGIFPVVIAYVEKIDLFFGGFPIVQFFKWVIIVMIGIFLVKAILKLLSFIPFIGGAG